MTINKSRIYITHQIQEEFIRNRIRVIRSNIKYIQNSSEHFNKLKDAIKTPLNTYLRLIDEMFANRFTEVKNKLYTLAKGIENSLENEEFTKDLTEAFEKVSNEGKNIGISDTFLDLCSQFQIILPLSMDERDSLITRYKDLRQQYGKNKGIENREQEKTSIETYYKEDIRPNYAFPGCCETNSDKYGDYIIFHELLQFVNKNQNSCVFLTNDVKDDWFEEKSQPIPHYISNVYALTNQIIYIGNAQESLEVNFKYQEEESENDVNIDTVTDTNFELNYEFSNPNENVVMKMVLANRSFEENLKHNIYYHQDWRSFRDHKYIGLYKEKAIRAIGEIENIVYADYQDDILTIKANKHGAKDITEEQKNRIVETIRLRKGDISTNHVFFCVKKFYDTEFIKTSLYAPMGTRYFDLGDNLGGDEDTLGDVPKTPTGKPRLPTTSKIAELLKGKTWK